LLGVFLGPEPPNLAPAPVALDFATQAARDYTNLAPVLKQVFFIGDGVNSAGFTQTVEVPPGATRLFLGPMDGFHWYDNVGSFTVTVAALRLNIRAIDSSSLEISWSTNASGYSLEYATSVPTSVWIPVTNSPGVVGNQFVVSIIGTNPQQFFRLRQ